MKTCLAVVLCTTVICRAFGNDMPTWLPDPIAPQDNPLTAEKSALGKRLFSETALSGTGHYSCASCHDPADHFVDGRDVAIGATGELLERHTPTLYNVAYNVSYGWEDLGLTTLVAQHRIPLLKKHPEEMGFSATSLQRIKQDPNYPAAFARAFGTVEISVVTIVKAIASYVRTIRPPFSAWDRYIYYADHEALNRRAKAGMTLFFSERLGCAHCHSSFNFSGPVKHSLANALPVFHHTGVGRSASAFRAPTLRAIKHTAPYMHDGSLKTLDDVLDHYETTPSERVPEFVLCATERRQLIEFLESL